jgi:hypothetical protein
MEITTYNADGTINETKHIDLQVPGYVEIYNEQYSFLNITAEEVEVVNSRKNTFRKSLLLRRLTAAIMHDYSNFQDAYRKEAYNFFIDIDVYVQKAGADQLIQIGDRIMTSIMRIYGNHSFYRRTKNEIIDDEQTFFEQVCTKRELYIYLDKVEHQIKDGGGYFFSSNWINVMFYHAIKSANTNRFYRLDSKDAIRFYYCLQNLINRYYYSLRNMEQAVKWMPDELKQQMYVLSAFVKRARMDYSLYVDESRVMPKLVNALSLVSAQHRRSLYEMFDIFCGRYPSIEFDNHFMLHMRIKDLPKPKNNEHEITLYNYNKHPYKCYVIDDNEICALRIPSIGNEVLSILQNDLNYIYIEYMNVRASKWKGSVEIDAKTFFNKHKITYDSWAVFYYYEIEKYKYGIPESDLLKPQRIFFHLVCDNIFLDEVLGFKKEIVEGLIEILIDHPCDSQEGLYECMFRMSYIKERDSKDLITVAKDKAMKYIGCLFKKEYNLVKPYYQSNFKDLMSRILSLENIKEKLVKPAPTKNFKGGFNLSLVYNVLGMLSRQGILAAGPEILDIKINSYAKDNNFIDKISERKRFMYEIKEIESEKKIIEVIIKEYIESAIKNM